MIRTAIAKLVSGDSIGRDLARDTMEQVLSGEAPASQIGALAVAMRLRGETAEEIAGMAEAMRARVGPIRTRRHPLIDTCGTGGDNAGTFNISTTVALVTASCGVAVAKHGNRAVSSRTGSADVLEKLGVQLDLTSEAAGRSLDMLGITFLFAPNYHSALKHAAAPRREIGVRTVFNVLGPLTNPAGATRQLLGVYAPQLVRTLAEVLGRLGSERAWVVHGDDGMDELTVFATNRVAELDRGAVREFVLDPADHGLRHAERDGVQGGDADFNAERIRAILEGQAGPGRDIVLLNAGAALVVAGVARDPAQGIAQAREAIDSGAARRKLDELAAFRA